MNPFGLAGPEFLGFYAAVSVAVLLTVLIVRHGLGPAGRPQRRLTDPYDIALLRGGPAEAIRVAVLALVERKLLTRSGTSLESVKGAPAQVTDPAEQAVIRACVLSIEGWKLLTNRTALAGFEPRQRELKAQGLAPNAALTLKQGGVAFAGLVLLGAIGGIKLAIATSAGHTNVSFLFFVTIFAVGVMGVITARRIWATPRGQIALGDLRDLFGALRGHPVSNRPDETLFLAAVFGISALPAAERAVMRNTFQPPPGKSSGCGSSGSCSSGSSCGGGGGGGGCGGCGS